MPDNLLMPEGSDPYYGQKYNQDMNNLLMQRASVLPLAQYANGRVGPAVPGILMDGWNAFWNAGDAAARGDWRGAGHAGAEAAGLAMTGALAMPRPAGSIGMGGTPKPAPQPQPGIRAYHGSPHDFDRFDMSRIGTGEGAQAYGHGLYFAESEGVAKSYRDALGGKAFGPKADGPAQWTLDGKPVDISKDPSHLAAWNLHQEGDRATALASLERQREFNLHGAQPGTPEYEYVGGPRYDQAIALLKSGADLPTPQRPGRMYEVRINADPNDFLDLDKGISEQPAKLQSALKEAIGKFRTDLDPIAQEIWGERFGTLLKSQRQDVYDLASKRGIAIDQDAAESWRGMLKDPKSTEVLRDSGIPGLKYFDAGSRDIGEGSRNYVVFRDDIIDIVKKYGIAAAASMYGIDAVNNAMGAANDQPQNLLMQGY